MRAELAKLAAKRKAIEAAQQMKLAEEAEQKATERMRELKQLMRSRGEPTQHPALEEEEPAEQAEPQEDADEPAAEQPTNGEPASSTGY